MWRSVLGAIAVLGTSCSPVPVYTIGDKPNGGIGFFPIVAMNQQKIVYQETWYELTLVRTMVPAGAKDDTNTYSPRAVRYTTDADAAAAIYQVFTTHDTPEGAWQAVKDAFIPPPVAPAKPTLPTLDVKAPTQLNLIYPAAHKDLDSLVSAGKLTIASIENSQVQAPGRTKQYVQVQAPYGGTAQGDVHLNENGTLAEGAGQVTDTMPGKWVDAFSAITSAAIGAVGGIFKAAGEGKPGLKGIELNVKEVHRLYTITLQRPVEYSDDTKCNAKVADRLKGSGDPNCLATLVISQAKSDAKGDEAEDSKPKKDEKSEKKGKKDKKENAE